MLLHFCTTTIWRQHTEIVQRFGESRRVQFFFTCHHLKMAMFRKHAELTHCHIPAHFLWPKQPKTCDWSGHRRWNLDIFFMALPANIGMVPGLAMKIRHQICKSKEEAIFFIFFSYKRSVVIDIWAEKNAITVTYFTETVLLKIVQEMENLHPATNTRNIHIALCDLWLFHLLKDTGCKEVFTCTGPQQRCKFRAEKYHPKWLPQSLSWLAETVSVVHTVRRRTLWRNVVVS